MRGYLTCSRDVLLLLWFCFFFKQKTAYEMRISDWSSDVCSSDLVTASLAKIKEAAAPFASRGDDSGTHKAELRLWKAAGIDPKQFSGGWYRETGSGMGATLNTAVGMGAYALTDRATWIAFGNKGDFKVAVEGDERMFNQYGIILVSPEKCPSVKADLGQQFIDWVLSDEGQQAIAAYKK